LTHEAKKALSAQLPSHTSDFVRLEKWPVEYNDSLRLASFVDPRSFESLILEASLIEDKVQDEMLRTGPA
jgi:hypothetical protein